MVDAIAQPQAEAAPPPFDLTTRRGIGREGKREKDALGRFDWVVVGGDADGQAVIADLSHKRQDGRTELPLYFGFGIEPIEVR